jgi:hypothetical protein
VEGTLQKHGFLRIVAITNSYIGWGTSPIDDSICKVYVPAGSEFNMMIPRGRKVKVLTGEINITPSL